MHSERLAYIEKLNNEQELSCEDVAALIAEIRELQASRALAAEWKPIAELPDWDKRPSRQFILVDGEREHFGIRWGRRWAGEAFIRRGTITGYRVEDINRILKDGDMDPFNYQVTHWMPFQLPYFPPEQ